MGGRSAGCGTYLEPAAAADAQGVQPADAYHRLATNTLHSSGSVLHTVCYSKFQQNMDKD